MSNITTSDPQPFTPRAEYLIIPFLAILGLLLALVTVKNAVTLPAYCHIFQMRFLVN
ncbi:hypothetical protein ANANG_G00144050 [Anguilla anguilla]|uniref:Uncharacterized protein n=1 Tax=Anguilla anguilla TaxID=7936 RepID=A0A9D3MBC7_ANGAN|nr:hypothetical protein ANANG_G00144050 [Anguilla anguilla]